MARTIRLDVADGVATITLDRPDKLNAFGDDMREQLTAALDQVAGDTGARALVITGAGRAFSAGGDVHHMLALKQGGAGFDALERLLELGSGIVTRIAALEIPTIAAVNGVAAGAGLNLALACDLRVASSQATFGETFVKIGLHPDWGGTYFLPRIVGLPKALELCWTGEMIDAAQAYLIGLVDRVIGPERFADDVTAFARQLAQAPQTSVRLAKHTLRASAARSLEACLDAEAEAQRQCWESADASEGLSAFADKRTPRFATESPRKRPAAWRFE
jgi:2-(1,2-epoxy-1,2-dihydrophenyl)acetyl-CoA isomerase